jgi:hypothetical protein
MAFSTTRSLRLRVRSDYGTSSKNGRFRFGELLDGLFDLMEEGFVGIDDGSKHDEVSILVG